MPLVPQGAETLTYTAYRNVRLVVPPPGVLANVSDVDAFSASLQPQSLAGGGEIVIAADGGFVFTPSTKARDKQAQLSVVITDDHDSTALRSVVINTGARSRCFICRQAASRVSQATQRFSHRHAVQLQAEPSSVESHTSSQGSHSICLPSPSLSAEPVAPLVAPRFDSFLLKSACNVTKPRRSCATAPLLATYKLLSGSLPLIKGSAKGAPGGVQVMFSPVTSSRVHTDPDSGSCYFHLGDSAVKAGAALERTDKPCIRCVACLRELGLGAGDQMRVSVRAQRYGYPATLFENSEWSEPITITV